MYITQFALAVSTITDALGGINEVNNDKMFYEDIMVNPRFGIAWLFVRVGLGLLGGAFLITGLMFDKYTLPGYILLVPSFMISLFATNPETLTTMFHLALIQIAIVIDATIYKCSVGVVVAIIIINGIRVKYPDNIAVLIAADKTKIPLQLCYLSIATQLVAAMLLLIGFSVSHYPSNAIAGVLLIPSIIGGFVVAYKNIDIFFFRLQYILLAVVVEILIN